MECTIATTRPATPAPLPVSLGGLLAAFAAVPDPRRQGSIDYPLPALLARQGAALLAPLGFADGRTPCQSTLHRTIAALCGARLSGALGAYFAPAAPDPPSRGARGVAIDGKAQRGRRRYQAGGSPVELPHFWLFRTSRDQAAWMKQRLRVLRPLRP